LLHQTTRRTASVSETITPVKTVDKLDMTHEIIPARSQPPLPLDRLILRTAPDPEPIEMDVLFVGAGPAGLAGAIELAQLVKRDQHEGGQMDLQIGVLEKAASLGEHNLSGAVVNPAPFRELFPDIPDSELPLRAAVTNERVFLLTRNSAVRIPTPPTMRNHGNRIGSICEIVRWLGERAEALNVNLFTGFPAASLLVDGQRVTGVRTAPSGLDRDGNPGPSAIPSTDIVAKVTALAEGTRGALAQAWLEWQHVRSANPQIYALGVKELWETKKPLDAVVHTLGWPLPRDAFGGSFFYPLEPNLLALGLVVGLDYKDAQLDVHVMLQRMKLHPFFREYLEGGELVEWGAKTIPEGGYYSIPERRHGDGVVLLGDSAGLVEVASLKGVHYAVQSGIYAARVIFAALKRGDASASALSDYDRMLDDSYVRKDLYERRNMRLTFKDGFYAGGFKSTLMTLTKGAFPGGVVKVEPDAQTARVFEPEEPFAPDGKLTFRKLDAVFKSGNATRDDIPSHLIVGEDVSGEVAEFYSHMCPAGVYERDGDRLVVNPPNCVDCKATDVLGPRWTPREGGAGPAYRRM
jgi:electron-transferring-flavoprotein dehydrogenase